MHIGIMQDSVNSVEGNYNDAVHLYTTDYWDGHYDDYGNMHLVSNGIIARIYVRPNYNRNVTPSITWFTIDNTTMTNTTFEARVWATDDESVTSVNVNAWVSGTSAKIKPDRTPYYDSPSGSWIAKYTISRLPNAVTGRASVICVEATATDNTGKTSALKGLYDIPVGGVETSLGDFTARIVPKKNTNFAIDISGSGNNSALKLKNKNTSRREQLWKFTNVGGKYYEISNVTNGKVITAKSMSEDNGTLLVLYDDNNAGHARFFLQKYNDGYRIIPNHTGFVRALDFNNYVDGKDIILWDNGSTWTNGAQTFAFEKIATSISLNKTSTSLNVGSSETLTVSFNPSDVANKTLNWTSSNTSVATVSNGKVTAIKAGTATITAKTKDGSNLSKTCIVTVVNPINQNVSVSYTTHVQQVGWQNYVSNGAMSGTSGKSLRLEGIKIKLEGATGGIEYNTYVQSRGWDGTWKSNDQESGTTGKRLRLEAIQIHLTGEIANQYDVYYCVHSQSFGWLNWAKNGQIAGTIGYDYRLEAIKIVLVKKGASAPANEGRNTNSFMQQVRVLYTTHVQGIGWQNYVSNGAMAGTSGRALRMEGIKIKLDNLDGSVQYRTHIQGLGWENGWKADDAMSGTSGRALRLEAIQIKLSGTAAKKYDIYYRVHAQGFGWLGWAKNGQSSGTAGYAKRLEGIEIKLVTKGGAAPGNTANAFRQK